MRARWKSPISPSVACVTDPVWLHCCFVIAGVFNNISMSFLPVLLNLFRLKTDELSSQGVFSALFEAEVQKHNL